MLEKLPTDFDSSQHFEAHLEGSWRSGQSNELNISMLLNEDSLVSVTASDYTSGMLQSVGFRKCLLYQGFQPILPAPQIMGHLRTKEICRDEAEKIGINMSLHTREQLFVLILYKILVQMMRPFPLLEFTKTFGKKNTAKTLLNKIKHVVVK